MRQKYRTHIAFQSHLYEKPLDCRVASLLAMTGGWLRIAYAAAMVVVLLVSTTTREVCSALELEEFESSSSSSSESNRKTIENVENADKLKSEKKRKFEEEKYKLEKRGKNFFKKGEYQKAYEVFEEYCEKKMGKAYVMRYLVATELNKEKESEFYYEKILEMCNTYEPKQIKKIKRTMGHGFYMLEKFEKALYWYHQIPVENREPKDYKFLSRIYRELGNFKEARDSYHQVALYNMTDRDYQLLSGIYTQLEKPKTSRFYEEYGKTIAASFEKY